MDSITIGTRGSRLALSQAEEIQKKLKHLFPKSDFQLKRVETQGDKTEKLLQRHSETVGFFTKELEESLLEESVDIAVHSLKDLPTVAPEKLRIAAITRRENPQDALVTTDGRSLSALRSGSRIGTGSERRKLQLLHFNGTFEVVGIRGNLDTRLRKLEEKGFDALVLAMAGLRRFGVDPKKVWPIPLDIMLPAPGQGALAVQVRKKDRELGEMVSQLDDLETRRCVTAERAFLSRLGGGCQLPLGALGTLKGKALVLEGVLLGEDGQREIRARLKGTPEDSEKVGEKLGDQFFEMGAEELLNGKG
ncbi:MAG: hydroxymethylbilane synthase [Candidatus Omnitrophica bacterium]|nr:hydroxymethylbilane synthase [Candidatus Omnitrophota bacterium]